MIGKAYVSVTPFFNIKTRKNDFKKRPVLIIGKADNNGDYVVLPISRVTNKAHLDEYYDIELQPDNFITMHLIQTSYVRTHKQTVINSNSLTYEITNFKENFPDTYIEIIGKVEDFQKNLILNAL